MTRYATLRTWSLVLLFIGVFSVISAVIGVIAWSIEVEGLGEVLAVIFLGGPLAVFLATWPIAMSQALRAIADIGDAIQPLQPAY